MTFHFGYIDPGTGSLFIQAIAGGVLGGLFVFRNLIGKAVIKIKGVGTSKDSVVDAKDK
jgi:hypothetical protein